LLLIWFTVGNNGIEAVSEFLRQGTAFLPLDTVGIGLPIATYLGIHLLVGSALLRLALRWKYGIPPNKELLGAWNTRQVRTLPVVASRTRNGTVFSAGFVSVIVVGLFLFL